MPRLVTPDAPPMRCAVVGHPVAHSLSPALHRAAYRRLGLDWSYEAVDVEPGGLARFVAGLDRGQWRGLSVTMPHKPDLVALGTPDDLVRLTGVANTLVLDPAGDTVHNTDVTGFVRACEAHGLARITRAVIVGNGATAASVLVAVSRMGARSITVLAREPRRGEHLVGLAADLGVACEVRRLGVPVDACDLVASTVPASALGPYAGALAATAPAVFDAVYDPWPTPLATAGRAAGRVVINGLDLLAGQGVDQVRLMTGGLVGFEVLRSAGEAALRARGETLRD